MSESLNQKIQKLLRLAERAGTPEEAESASRMAERLMLKWGIDEAMLRSTMGNGEKPEAIVTKSTAPFPAAFVKPRTSVAGAVVKGMGNMRIWISNAPGSTTVMVMGFESDVDRALTLIPSLLLQADHSVAQWWKNYPLRKGMTAAQAKNAKRQFLFGFGNSVQRRLSEMRVEEIRDNESTSGGGAGIVLRDRGALVDQEFNDTIALNLRKARPLKGSLHGGSAGREAGERARLGGATLPGGRRALG